MHHSELVGNRETAINCSSILRVKLQSIDYEDYYRIASKLYISASVQHIWLLTYQHFERMRAPVMSGTFGVVITVYKNTDCIVFKHMIIPTPKMRYSYYITCSKENIGLNVDQNKQGSNYFSIVINKNVYLISLIFLSLVFYIWGDRLWPGH